MDNQQKFSKLNEVKKEYAKILNNLLDISQSDSALYSRVDNKKFFDVFVKFGEEIQNKVLNQKDFSFKLIEVDKPNFINALENSHNFEEVKNVYDNFNYNLSEDKEKYLKQNFQITLNNIISHTKSKIQKRVTKWRILQNNAIDINTENNIWPLHLGYLFISVNTEKKSIFAPLFFKEVQLNIKNSIGRIKTTGETKINEKLLFLLKNEGLNLEIDLDFTNITMNEVIKKLHQKWSVNFQMIDSIKGAIPNIDQNDINNEQIIFHPGVSLGFYMPTGGYLRNRMIEILENNEMDNIFPVEFNKNIYQDRIDEILLKTNSILYKIQETNLSQDKAIISALNQNTIIWGPPGTGKSQTITNIITNILAFERTALVVSQKKAALVVLRDRMKALSIFCLFILNSRLLTKKEFYDPIVKYLNKLEHFKKSNSVKGISLISIAQREFLDKLKELKHQENFDDKVAALGYIYRVNQDYSKKDLMTIFSLNKNIKYDVKEYPENFKKYLKKLLEANAIKKSFFQKVPREIEENATKAFENLKEYNGHLNEILFNIKNVSREDIENISDIKNLKFQYNEQYVNDEKDITQMILEKMFKKIDSMGESFKKEYIKFAMTVRSAHMNPQKFIEKFHRIIKVIFPIIITTPETELGLWKKCEFDYAILDESSQIFIEKGLPVLYLAKINILAGDIQQMQPTRWFSTRVDDEDDFGGIESLLDFATSKGGFSVLLDKNYRSNFASLMTFSSKHFYNGELDVLNVNTPNYELPIDVYNVDGKWENSTNVEEGIKVLELTEINLEKYEQIIILCFNSTQQNLIEKAIFENKPNLIKAIEKQKLLLRNIENIQGNEADLIIVSVSYDSTTKLHTTYVAKSGGKNALNVAISRAKDKMIVVKSIYAKNIDLTKASEDMIVFREWLNFLDLDENQRKNYIDTSKIKPILVNDDTLKSNDDLINQVYTLLSKTLEFESNAYALKNYSVGTKKIDIAILENNTNVFKLGLTIDNFNYSDSYIDLIENIDNELFIITKQYKLRRIILSEWMLDKNRIIKEIINAIM